MTATYLTHPQLDIGLKPMRGHLFVKLDDAKPPTGLVLPDTYERVENKAVVLATGDDTHTPVGVSVFLTPACGVSLSVSAPKFDLPPSILDIEEDDVLATYYEDWAEVWKRCRIVGVPSTSLAAHWVPIENHVLMRPYSPAGVYTGGIIAAKNEKFPRVWAHLLTVPVATFDRNPDLVPGRMVVYARYSDELLGYDTRANGDKDLAVVIAPIEELKACMFPAPVTLEVD